MNPETVKEIYHLRNKFIIIGLTGRTGSGCTEVARILSNDFVSNNFPKPSFSLVNNKQRKYRIIYGFAQENYKKFTLINYKDLITSFIIGNDFKEFLNYVSVFTIQDKKIADKIGSTFTDEIDNIITLQNDFEKLNKRIKDIDFDNIRKKQEIEIKQNYLDIYDFFFGTDYVDFCKKFNKALGSSVIKRILFLQSIANNIRQNGECYKGTYPQNNKVHSIVNRLNQIIKSCRKKNNLDEEDKATRIVIDSLRNSLEIMYLKERYSAFYMFAVKKEDTNREKTISKRYYRIDNHISSIDKKEYESKNKLFYEQDVSNCIQKSDIHLNNIDDEQLAISAEDSKQTIEYKQNTFGIKKQIIKYVSLIMQPGIITPSPEERCMQIAYTAKCNSGCISRQVGAVVVDDSFSIKSIGWNNTPEGHVPCLLRDVRNLLSPENPDGKAFSLHEKNDPTKKFHTALRESYETKLANSTLKLCGKNVSFCFKDIRNSYTEGKNQVHTRSAHAEENAFLQISKYGGMGLKNGILFTTASPCELCAKKAYQIGIKKIYYIDPYPGIAETHILKGGNHQYNPELVFFHGAIGRSYHKLYEPFMAYKDELTILLGLQIHDENKKLKGRLAGLKEENRKLKLKIVELQTDSNKI